MYNIIMSDIDYYQKYLKYKTKYLDLKNDIDGGMFKKKPLTKEKFDAQVKKIEEDVDSRNSKKYDKFTGEIAKARGNMRYFMSIDCHSDFDKHGYRSIDRCLNDTKLDKDEKKERTNKRNLKALNDGNKKIQDIIKEVKNSTDDFENQLKKLKTAYADFKNIKFL